MNPIELLKRLDSIAPTPDAERDYLGASEIGTMCERALWLKFNKYSQPKQFSPRMLRLLERGNNEEYSLAKLVEGIGADPIARSDGQCGQHGFSDIGNFFRGHSDGLYVLDGRRINVEYKTHNEKSFKQLRAGDGINAGNLQAVKPLHYAQCIIYPGYLNCEGTLYLAFNKNNDELFCDWIPFNADELRGYQEKARRIIMAEKPFERVCVKPEEFTAKFCDEREVCFGMVMPRVHCRNCTSWTRSESGERCEIGKVDGPCEHHSFNPFAINSLMGWEPIEFYPSTRSVKYDNGIINGYAGVASVEMKI